MLMPPSAAHVGLSHRRYNIRRENSTITPRHRSLTSLYLYTAVYEREQPHCETLFLKFHSINLYVYVTTANKNGRCQEFFMCGTHVWRWWFVTAIAGY